LPQAAAVAAAVPTVRLPGVLVEPVEPVEAAAPAL